MGGGSTQGRTGQVSVGEGDDAWVRGCVRLWLVRMYRCVDVWAVLMVEKLWGG